MVCHLFGTKPSFETIMACWYLDLWEEFSVKCDIKWNHILKKNCLVDTGLSLLLHHLNNFVVTDCCSEAHILFTVLQKLGCIDIDATHKPIRQHNMPYWIRALWVIHEMLQIYVGTLYVIIIVMGKTNENTSKFKKFRPWTRSPISSVWDLS